MLRFSVFKHKFLVFLRFYGGGNSFLRVVRKCLRFSEFLMGSRQNFSFSFRESPSHLTCGEPPFHFSGLDAEELPNILYRFTAFWRFYDGATSLLAFFCLCTMGGNVVFSLFCVFAPFYSFSSSGWSQKQPFYSFLLLFLSWWSQVQLARGTSTTFF